MIFRPLLKLAVTLGLAAFLVVQLGSPVIVRAQVDDAAHDVAQAGAAAISTVGDPGTAQQAATAAATAEAATRKVTLDSVTVTGRLVEVTVSRTVGSYLERIRALHSWYHVSVTADATATS